jgi:hypothetical protein
VTSYSFREITFPTEPRAGYWVTPEPLAVARERLWQARYATECAWERDKTERAIAFAHVVLRRKAAVKAVEAEHPEYLAEGPLPAPYSVRHRMSVAELRFAAIERANAELARQFHGQFP